MVNDHFISQPDGLSLSTWMISGQNTLQMRPLYNEVNSSTSVKPNENKLKMKILCKKISKRITLQPHNIIREMKITFSN